MIKNIVLIHGAFADGSCYAEVIRYLQEAGIKAVPCKTRYLRLSVKMRR